MSEEFVTTSLGKLIPDYNYHFGTDYLTVFCLLQWVMMIALNWYNGSEEMLE